MVASTKIGLVLSGGGYKGVAHIGAIKALEEHNIKPHFISGTSAGALVGSLYAAGYSPEDIKTFFKKTSLFRLNRFTRSKAGFFDSEKYYDDLATYFPEDSFAALEKKLFVTATDLVEGVVKVFSRGELIRPIIASAAFPGVFSPIMINNHLYADGGILDNFPVQPIKQKSEFIVGVDVSPIKKPKITDFKHSFNVMQRAYYLRAMPNSMTRFNECDIIIHPKELINYGLFSNTNTEKVYEIGYQEAKKQIAKLLKEQKNDSTSQGKIQ
ncbi:patatin-like phospholipase family protein [Aquimarina brevivitae]|uniref:NTE family protein n=1 Tax=Aquimarina brevivitae TaxID=323412 RepID=A0A4V2F7G2_9FLAO|nr:patatin-like phospholipase family protein [Aquimarina brevivitae]RZS99709.1 NTE family protein [Aquimarina brevivitae]